MKTCVFIEPTILNFKYNLKEPEIITTSCGEKIFSGGDVENLD